MSVRWMIGYTFLGDETTKISVIHQHQPELLESESLQELRNCWSSTMVKMKSWRLMFTPLWTNDSSHDSCFESGC